jgi:hypothetical protein
MSHPLSSSYPDEFLTQALSAVPAEKDGGWAELFLESSETVRCEWDLRSGLRVLPGIREGFALRWVGPSGQRHVSAEGLDAGSILAACRRPQVPPSADRAAADGAGENPSFAGEERRSVAAITGDLSGALARALPAGTVFSVALEWRRRFIRVAASGRPPRSEAVSRAAVIVRLESPGGDIALGAGAPDLDRLLEGHPAGALAREAVERLELHGDSRDAPEGESVVVLAPGTGGVFFHEACGHALEGDLVLRDASIFRDLLGEKVAPEFVGAMDDSGRPGLEGSYAWDDEGSEGRGTVLIEEGRLKGFLADRITGDRLGGGTTGNGRRESFRDLPLPRMSNTFLVPGQDDPESILRETPRGIYVRRLEGGRVDTATGEFLFRADSGSLIEEGRLTAPLRPFSIAGNGLAALRGIERVGGDLYFGSGAGSCGKEGQKVPVAAGQPTIRLRSLIVRPG